MLNTSKKILITTLLCLLPLASFAWNALGHMVVANIAYQHLKPAAKEKVDQLVVILNEQYRDMNTFENMSYWADMLRAQKIETYKRWHYIDHPFSNDNTPLKNTIDTDNAVWALENIKVVVKNTRANPYERSRFLAFLIHITGDLHQPLHTTTHISAAHPDGDNGGNLHTVIYKNKKTNLHKLWDNGLEAFAGESSKEHANQIANALIAQYPQAYFGDKAKDVNPDNWAKEGVENSMNHVYLVNQNQTVTANYMASGKQVAEQNVALAGYRLAAILNAILT